MRIRTAVVLAGALAICAGSMGAGPSPIIAAGGGVVQAPDGQASVAFSAADRDGSVSGNVQIVVLADTTVRVHAQITSMMMVDGSALFGGPVTQSSDADIAPIGFTLVFGVRDNGVGGDPAPDGLAVFGAVPPDLFPDVQAVVAAFGPPPPDAFLPLIGGDYRVR